MIQRIRLFLNTTLNNEREGENIEIGESIPNEDILNQGLEETFNK